jgi:hypothetical protein
VQDERPSSVKGKPSLAIEYSNSSEILKDCKKRQVKPFKPINESINCEVANTSLVFHILENDKDLNVGL